MAYIHATPVRSDVVFLEVIKPLVDTFSNKLYTKHNIPVGSITWVSKTHWNNRGGQIDVNLHIEDNRFATNFSIASFKEYKKSEKEYWYKEGDFIFYKKEVDNQYLVGRSIQFKQESFQGIPNSLNNIFIISNVYDNKLHCRKSDKSDWSVLFTSESIQQGDIYFAKEKTEEEIEAEEKIKEEEERKIKDTALIKEAERRGFVMGCRYRGCIQGNIHKMTRKISVFRDGTVECGIDYIYHGNKWAEVVDNVLTLEKAKVKIANYGIKKGCTLNYKTFGSYTMQQDECKYIMDSNNSAVKFIDPGTGCPFIYDATENRDSWRLESVAYPPIPEVTTPMFFEGSYIVVLKDGNSFIKTGYVYKIGIASKYLIVEKNNNGTEWRKSTFLFKSNSWRIATSHEIYEYNLFNRPCVASYPPKVSVGNVSFVNSRKGMDTDLFVDDSFIRDYRENPHVFPTNLSGSKKSKAETVVEIKVKKRNKEKKNVKIEKMTSIKSSRSLYDHLK